MHVSPHSAPGSSSQAPPDHEEWRTRRYHTKSRNGCSSCKKRRKRCDQRKLICGACLSRGTICVYGQSGQGEKSGEKSGQTSGEMRVPSTSTQVPNVQSIPGSSTAARTHRRGGAPLIRILPANRRDPFDSLSVQMDRESGLLFDHWVVFWQQMDKLVVHDLHGVIDVPVEENPFRVGTLLIVAAGHLRAMTKPSNDMLRAIAYQRSTVMSLSRVFIDEFMKFDELNMHEAYATLTRGMFYIDLGLNEQEAAETHLRAFHSVYDARESRGESYMRLDLGINQNFYYFGLWWAARKARTAAALDADLTGGMSAKLARNLSTAVYIWAVTLAKFVMVQPAFWEPDPSIREMTKWLLPASVGALLKWLLDSLRADRAAQIADEEDRQRKDREGMSSGSRRSTPNQRRPPYQGALYDPNIPFFDWKLAFATHALAIGTRRTDEDGGLSPRQSTTDSVKQPQTGRVEAAHSTHTRSQPSDIPFPSSSPNLGPVPIRAKPEPKMTPMDRLRELRRWTVQMQNKWRQAPKMVEWDGAQEILGRVLWLWTDEGMEVLDLICAECIPQWVSDQKRDEAA